MNCMLIGKTSLWHKEILNSALREGSRERVQNSKCLRWKVHSLTLGWKIKHLHMDTSCFWKASGSPCGQCTEGAHSHNVAGRVPVYVAECLRQGALGVQQVVWHHQGEGRGHAKVRKEANEQRGHYTDGDGTHGVLCLLTCGKKRLSGFGSYSKTTD